jgi:hypothetical protein
MEANMNRRILLFFFTFYFIIFVFNLLAQETWIRTYQPFGDVDSYGVNYLNICQDGGFAVNGFYHIYDPEFNIDEDWAYLMKVDSEGNFEWAYEETELWFTDHRSPCFAETDDGGFLMIVTSIWGGTAIVKLDREGNRLWAVDGQNFYPHSLDRTIDGHIILAGRMNGLPAIRKINQNAEILYENTFYLSGSGSGCINSISMTADNDFITTGYTSGNGFDVFVLKMDSQGDSLWCQLFDGFGYFDEGNCIIENGENNIFTVGRAANPWNGPLLWMLDPNGNTIWIEYETAHIGDEQFSVFNTPDNNLIINGGNIYKADYDYNLIWEQDFACGGEKALKFINNEFMVCPGILIENLSHHILIRKTDIDGNVAISNDEFVLANDILQCYPNPFNPLITLKFSCVIEENKEITIYNLKGNKVEHFLISKNQKEVFWNAENQASGIYFVNLKQNGKKIQTKKITLLK